MNMQPHCIVAGGTVTALCTETMINTDCMAMTITDIPANHTSISGTITVWIAFQANSFCKKSYRPRTSSWQNWSKEMWQSVLNRAVRTNTGSRSLYVAILHGSCSRQLTGQPNYEMFGLN
ncbi:hypothetical protein KIN20_001976 [Parelaphostrongylus tenuis]|uniref:Uncharacterized protein n=1 Tax=Parelaphostrongylus tenuis TaxID=148309 RepID=A0AAD5LXS9_PARTN|nr:hypothetical protein KIN20_001973 [Parelaphostrongylus tenuis]KAJ1347036.1 hypothetical protein KIN20_001976 [Parelaphostrongylus tenuis]